MDKGVEERAAPGRAGRWKALDGEMVSSGLSGKQGPRDSVNGTSWHVRRSSKLAISYPFPAGWTPTRRNMVSGPYVWKGKRKEGGRERRREGGKRVRERGKQGRGGGRNGDGGAEEENSP